MLDNLKKYWSSTRLLFGVAAIVIALDQITKYMVRRTLWPTQVWVPIGWLEPYFKIVHWKNSGASFGIFENGSPFFAGLAVLAIIIILIYYPRISRTDMSLRWSLAFLMGGITSNLIDRLHQGYVTDLIAVGPTYVLNLADLSNLIGVIIILWGVLSEEKRKKKPINADQEDTSKIS
jgi:signal peptidase II